MLSFKKYLDREWEKLEAGICRRGTWEVYWWRPQVIEALHSIFLSQRLGISSQARPETRLLTCPLPQPFPGFPRSPGHFSSQSEPPAAWVKKRGGEGRALAASGLGLCISGSSVAQSHAPWEGIILSIPRKGRLHCMSVKWECGHNGVLRAGTSGEATILLGWPQGK